MTHISNSTGTGNTQPAFLLGILVVLVSLNHNANAFSTPFGIRRHSGHVLQQKQQRVGSSVNGIVLAAAGVSSSSSSPSSLSYGEQTMMSSVDMTVTNDNDDATTASLPYFAQDVLVKQPKATNGGMAASSTATSVPSSSSTIPFELNPAILPKKRSTRNDAGFLSSLGNVMDGNDVELMLGRMAILIAMTVFFGEIATGLSIRDQLVTIFVS